MVKTIQVLHNTTNQAGNASNQTGNDQLKAEGVAGHILGQISEHRHLAVGVHSPENTAANTQLAVGKLSASSKKIVKNVVRPLVKKSAQKVKDVLKRKQQQQEKQVSKALQASASAGQLLQNTVSNKSDDTLSMVDGCGHAASNEVMGCPQSADVAPVDADMQSLVAEAPSGKVTDRSPQMGDLRRTPTAQLQLTESPQALTTKSKSHQPSEMNQAALMPFGGSLDRSSHKQNTVSMRAFDGMEPATASTLPAGMDADGTTNGDREKYYKKFDFFYRRTAFRSMTEFYKGHFKPRLDKWREGERKSTKPFVLQYLWKKSEMDVQSQKVKGGKSARASGEKAKDLRKLANYAKSQQNKQSGQGFQKTVDQVERKLTTALKSAFQTYSNGDTEVATPICDADKKILKQNMRKLAIYDSAYRFCEDLFDLNGLVDGRSCDVSKESSQQTEEQHGDAPMTAEQLLEFTSAILSIVLSHHFQKKDIVDITEGTPVDFVMVRDTMYRYSKKAEERYFRNACMAYFFVQFARGKHGRAYIETKLAKNAEQAEKRVEESQGGAGAGNVDESTDFQVGMTSMVSFAGGAKAEADAAHTSFVSFAGASPSKSQQFGKDGGLGGINQPQNKKNNSLLQSAVIVSSGSKLGQPRQNQNLDPVEALERQNQLNERIISEIEMMSDEALQFLQDGFERELNTFVAGRRTQIMQIPPEQRLGGLKKAVHANVLSYVLLLNLEVDVESLIVAKLDQMSSNKLDLICTPQKPLLESIMEDISLSKQRSQLHQTQDVPMNQPERHFRAAEQPHGVSNFCEPTLFGQNPFSNGNAFMTPPKKGNGAANQAASKQSQQNAQLSGSGMQSTATRTAGASRVAGSGALSASKKVAEFQPYATRKAPAQAAPGRGFDAAAMLKSVQQSNQSNAVGLRGLKKADSDILPSKITGRSFGANVKSSSFQEVNAAMRDSSEQRQNQQHAEVKGFGVPGGSRKGSGTSSDEQRPSPCFQKMPSMDHRRHINEHEMHEDAPVSPPSDHMTLPKNTDQLHLDRTASPVINRRISAAKPVGLTRSGLFDQIDAFAGHGREDETPVKSPYVNFQAYAKEEDSPSPDPYPEPFGYRKMESASTPQKMQMRAKRVSRPTAGNVPVNPNAAEASASRFNNSISSFKNQTSLWNTTAVNAFGTQFAAGSAESKQYQRVKMAPNSKQSALYSPTLIRPNTGKGAPAVLTGRDQPGRVDNALTAKDVHRQKTLDLLRGMIKEHNNRSNAATDDLLKKNDTPESVISSHKVSPPDSSFDLRPSMSQMLLSGQKRQQQMLAEEQQASVSRELFPKQPPVFKTTPPDKIVKMGVRNLKSPMLNQPMSGSRNTYTFNGGKENEMSLFSGLPSLSMGTVIKNCSAQSGIPSGSDQTGQQQHIDSSRS